MIGDSAQLSSLVLVRDLGAEKDEVGQELAIVNVAFSVGCQVTDQSHELSHFQEQYPWSLLSLPDHWPDNRPLCADKNLNSEFLAGKKIAIKPIWNVERMTLGE